MMVLHYGRVRCGVLHKSSVGHRHQMHRSPCLRPVRCSAPNWNPQNVQDPKVLPTPSMSVQDAVRVQLDALLDNNEPWPNHGIQTMYEFGEDIGGLDPSLYFGFKKDLYHFDHYMGQFQAKLPQLMDLASYEVVSMEPVADDQTEVKVNVVTTTGASGSYCFLMKVKDIGRKKGSWMTKRLTPC